MIQFIQILNDKIKTRKYACQWKVLICRMLNLPHDSLRFFDFLSDLVTFVFDLLKLVNQLVIVQDVFSLGFRDFDQKLVLELPEFKSEFSLGFHLAHFCLLGFWLLVLKYPRKKLILKGSQGGSEVNKRHSTAQVRTELEVRLSGGQKQFEILVEINLQVSQSDQSSSSLSRGLFVENRVQNRVDFFTVQNDDWQSKSQGVFELLQETLVLK
jgi:hypothetical protein